MTRKEFIQKSMMMGISMPFISSTLLQSCVEDGTIFPNFDTNFKGKVIIIGAGAAFRKQSQENVLGLFAIKEKAAVYTRLKSEEEITTKFLTELDEIFDGKATKNYISHIIQNWSNEPYIQGAYSYSFEENQKSIVEIINKPIMDKIYFAGEALSIQNQATVHGACESAYSMVATMMKDA